MLNIIPIKQKPFECGPVVLKMILNFYGVEKSEDELKILVKYVDGLGTTGENIAEAAKDLGFFAEIKDNAEISDIETFVNVEKIPVIVSWFLEFEAHFSVALQIDSENIYLQDPYIGDIRVIGRDNFRRVWFDFEGEFIENKDDLILRRIIIIRKK